MLITTLPITPKPRAPFTTLLAPFVANILAAYSDSTLVVANNLTGLKLAGSEQQNLELQLWYHNCLYRLGIESFYTWSELETGYFEFVNKIIDDQYNRGIICEKAKNILC